MIMTYSDTERISLKYCDGVPEDYDVPLMQATFDFIYLVHKRDASISEAIRGISYEYDLSKSFLMNYFTENKYLLSKTDEKESVHQLKKYNTKALKRILKKHGLKASGKRERIEKRIIENGLLQQDYYLSSKSRIFYKNKKRRMRIFDKFLIDYYYFTEFNEFYMDNFRKKEEKIPVAFIDLHISKSVEDKNHEMFCLNNLIMAEHFLSRNNYKAMAEYVLKDFCININPMWKTDDLKSHEGFSQVTYDNLLFLKSKIGKNRIISAFYYIWDSFDFEKIIVSKYIGYRCLKDVLNGKDYDKIIADLRDNYYSKEDLKIKRITQKTLFDF